ncbi:MAG: ATP-binding protein [Prevotellaceae bacterium]|nr:ATP-binding protein [Prevotellaceae bacterium]
MNSSILENTQRVVSDLEHIRLRPGMYVGKCGNGSEYNDGIYLLIIEILNNSVDQFKMGNGNQIDITVNDNKSISIRDYAGGIPFENLTIITQSIAKELWKNSGFIKCQGLSGIGLLVVNALSSSFEIQSIRDGHARRLKFAKGILIEDETKETKERNGVCVNFTPDDSIFKDYHLRTDVIESMIFQYCCLNAGLVVKLNGIDMTSRNGLADLLIKKTNHQNLYEPIRLVGDKIEIAFTHVANNKEQYWSFVNGRYTICGGKHYDSLEESLCKILSKKLYWYSPSVIRNGLIAAISLNIKNPIYEDSCFHRLGSIFVDSESNQRIDSFIRKFIREELNFYFKKSNAKMNFDRLMENRIFLDTELF